MNEYFSYAISFVSFLVKRIELDNVKEIVLFGSVPRGSATKESDVDLFIDVVENNKSFEKKVASAVKEFYKSEFFRMWKLQRIDNEIKCITGRLENWKELNQSMIANGITLYSKHRGKLEGENSVIIYWDNVRPESKRVMLSKKLYGYKTGNKEYEGTIKKSKSGLKLGTNCIIVPLEESELFLNIFKKLGVKFRTLYITKFK